MGKLCTHLGKCLSGGDSWDSKSKAKVKHEQSATRAALTMVDLGIGNKTSKDNCHMVDFGNWETKNNSRNSIEETLWVGIWEELDFSTNRLHFLFHVAVVSKNNQLKLSMEWTGKKFKFLVMMEWYLGTGAEIER